MSNPTTPFGWQMPTNTDLVTDLPADFEVFGQAVATSMQDLLGGTTGQVLKKNTNADMDFVWSADAAGMTNPMTTTGDVIYSSPGSTPVRLGIGTANQILAVNSGATAPEWKTVSGGGMTLLSTTTLSGTSTNISSIDQTYKDLFVIVTGVTNTTADGYRYIRPNNTSSIAMQAVARPLNLVNIESDIYIPRDGNTTFNNSDNAASVIIYNYSSSTTNKPFNGSITYTETGEGNRAQVFGGGIKTNTAITSLVFVQSGGGSFNAGTVKIYGVN